MNRIAILSLSFFVSAVLLTGCSNKSQDLKNSEVHWGYKGEMGPNNWGSLNEDFKLCTTGSMQTPINIVATKDIELEALRFNYEVDSTNLTNTGHSIQVSSSNGNTVLIDDKEYSLKQFHFHTPSENSINNRSYPLEAHFVHQAQDNSLAVVTVMYEEGEKNNVLEKISANLPLKEDIIVDLKLSSEDIKGIIPPNKDYYKFMGSLTTPPCSENVKWIVFKNHVNVSKGQIQKFFDSFGHENNRPIQKSNGRAIFE